MAHVISTRGLGGAERLVGSLLSGGIDNAVEQIVLNPFADDFGQSLLREEWGRHYQPYRVNGPLQVPGMSWWLQTALRRFRPDVVHVHLFHALVAVALAPRPGRTKLLLTHHHGDRMKTEGRRVEAFLDKWCGRRYDHIVACSNFVKEFLVRHYHYDSDRLSVVRNGWQGAPMTRDGGRTRPTIVSVSNFRPPKGHFVLLSAFEKVMRQHPEARLVLVGTGVLELELKQEVDRLGLIQHVTFTGLVRDVWPYLAQGDVFVLPSLHETLGIAAMEAMAAGLPVVASAVGGIPEVVVDGVTGKLVRPGDSEALAGEIIGLLKSPTLRAELGARGKERALTMTMDKTVQQYYELYFRLAKQA